MSLPPGQSLGALALEELELRRSRAQAMRNDRRIGAEQANALLAPWAALALWLADDPSSLIEQGMLSPLMEDWQTLRASSLGTPVLSPRAAGTILARDLCPHTDMLAVVATARDTALSRTPDVVEDPARRAALHRMITLANAIGCPPFAPRKSATPPVEKEAA